MLKCVCLLLNRWSSFDYWMKEDPPVLYAMQSALQLLTIENVLSSFILMKVVEFSTIKLISIALFLASLKVLKVVMVFVFVVFVCLFLSVNVLQFLKPTILFFTLFQFPSVYAGCRGRVFLILLRKLL